MVRSKPLLDKGSSANTANNRLLQIITKAIQQHFYVCNFNPPFTHPTHNNSHIMKTQNSTTIRGSAIVLLSVEILVNWCKIVQKNASSELPLFVTSYITSYYQFVVGTLNLFFFNIWSSLANIRILFEVRKWPRRPGDDAQRPPPLLHHLITQQVVHVRPSGSHQRESAHLPTPSDASSKHPTTDSKDHDRRLTIVSRYAGYFHVVAGRGPRWVA